MEMMWAWLAAYGIGFALLQAYLYMYFVNRRSPGSESPTEGTPQFGESRAHSIDPSDRSSDGDVVSCANCGTYNESSPMYTFCKECGSRL